MDWKEVVDEILPFLKESCKGPYFIGLGGSIAKGCADEFADIDIYIVSREWGDLKAVEKEISKLQNVESGVSWDIETQGGVDFTYNGIPVECWWRRLDDVKSEYLKAYSGEIETKSVHWTPGGFFNYTILSDIYHIKTVYDSENILLEWQNNLKEYPESLRNKVIKFNRGVTEFWRGNPHLESAFKRDDIIYLSSIRNQIVLAISQIIFAVNRVYFSGDKKIAAKLGLLSNTPDFIEERINTLLIDRVSRENFKNLYKLFDEIIKFL